MGQAPFAMWQGFDFAWQRTPHRLNQLGSWVEETPEGAHAAARLTLGRVPDRGRARVHVAELSAPGIRGRSGDVRVRLAGSPGEGMTVRSAPVAVPLGGADPSSSTVVLRGFELCCRSHPAGVHIQGFGLRVDDIRAEDHTLTFVAELYLRANHSPDPLTRWRGDVVFDARLFYTALLADRGALAPRRPATRPCATVRHDHRMPPPTSQEVMGDPRFRGGALALRGFRFEQLHQGRWRRDGRYLRRFHLWLGAPAWDGSTARMRWAPMAWFSNAGMVAYPLHAEHRLWTTLIQTRDPVALRRRVVEFGVRTGLEARVRVARL